MNKKFYITTTIPYVNADPHIGFTLEIVQADAVARFKRLEGYNVCFNFGTDEHGLKIYRRALEEKKEPQKYCDEYAVKWAKLKSALNLSYTNFVRTTDKHHIEAAQVFWKRCLKNNDIEKKKYKSKYCVGCELEKTDSELGDGKCPIHPNLKLEIIEEENYFFKFSKYQKPLLEFYQKNPDFVIPQYRFREIKAFVSKGLQDFSVSRLKSKMPWGIDVPDDSDQVMYVWFDALINYISTLGWPEDTDAFNNWWPGTQVAGKDNLRQQTAIWQAMLMSAGLPNSRQIFIHGFITSEGQKISKSLGNVVNPFDLVKKYGTDAVRYYLLREIPSYDDGNFSERRFKEIYNSDLANGLGNAVSRIAKLCENSNYKIKTDKIKPLNMSDEIKKRLNEFRFDLGLELIWTIVKRLNIFLDTNKPWTLKGEELEKILDGCVSIILDIARNLKPFLPETSNKIFDQFLKSTIKSQPPLFPRLRV